MSICGVFICRYMVVLDLDLYYFLRLIYVGVLLFVDLWCIFICGCMVLLYAILGVELGLDFILFFGKFVEF